MGEKHFKRNEEDRVMTRKGCFYVAMGVDHMCTCVFAEPLRDNPKRLKMFNQREEGTQGCNSILSSVLLLTSEPHRRQVLEQGYRF